MTAERTARPAVCVQGRAAAVTPCTSASVTGAVEVFHPRAESACVCAGVLERVLTESLYVCICVCVSVYRVWAEVIKVSGNMHY